MKKELIAFFTAMFPDKKKEIDLLEATLKEPEPSKVDPPKVEPDTKLPKEVQSQFDEIKKMNEALTKQLKELSDKTVDSEKNQLKEKVEAVIQKAIVDKKMPAKNEEVIKTYRTLLESNFDTAKTVVESLPVIGTPAPSKVPAASGTPAASETSNYAKNPKPFLEAAAAEFAASTKS